MDLAAEKQKQINIHYIECLRLKKKCFISLHRKVRDSFSATSITFFVLFSGDSPSPTFFEGESLSPLTGNLLAAMKSCTRWTMSASSLPALCNTSRALDSVHTLKKVDHVTWLSVYIFQTSDIFCLTLFTASSLWPHMKFQNLPSLLSQSILLSQHSPEQDSKKNLQFNVSSLL